MVFAYELSLSEIWGEYAIHANKCSHACFLLFPLTALAVTLFFAYQYGYTNSDMSVELILARHLADTGRLLSTEWFYTTELRFANTQLITMPLFLFLDNWATVRLISAVIANTILLLSYFYMMKQTVVSWPLICLTSVFLMTPYTHSQLLIYAWGLFYIPHAVIMFCMIGLLLKLKKEHTHWHFTIYCALAFVAGVGGVRYIKSIAVPLLLAVGIIEFGRIKANPEFFATEYDIPLLFAMRKAYFKFRTAVFGVVFIGLGFVVNITAFSRYNFDNMGSMGYQPTENLRATLPSHLSEIFGILIEFFGYRPGVRFVSTEGVLSIAGLIFAIGIIAITVHLVRKMHFVADENIFVVSFAVGSLVFSVFLLLVPVQRGDSLISRYLYLSIIFYIPILAIFFSGIQRRWHQLVIIFIVCTILLGQSGHFMLRHRHDGVSYRRPVVQFLAESGMKFGYASFWNAAVTTELSNGEITVVGLYEQIDFSRTIGHQIHRWGILKQHTHSVHHHSNEVFLLLDHSQFAIAIAVNAIDVGIVVFECPHFVVIQFENVDTLLGDPLHGDILKHLLPLRFPAHTG